MRSVRSGMGNRVMYGRSEETSGGEGARNSEHFRNGCNAVLFLGPQCACTRRACRSETRRKDGRKEGGSDSAWLLLCDSGHTRLTVSVCRSCLVNWALCGHTLPGEPQHPPYTASPSPLSFTQTGS